MFFCQNLFICFHVALSVLKVQPASKRKIQWVSKKSHAVYCHNNKQSRGLTMTSYDGSTSRKVFFLSSFFPPYGEFALLLYYACPSGIQRLVCKFFQVDGPTKWQYTAQQQFRQNICREELLIITSYQQSRKTMRKSLVEKYLQGVQKQVSDNLAETPFQNP